MYIRITYGYLPIVTLNWSSLSNRSYFWHRI